MLVVRRNARLKLVCDEKPALSAICTSGNSPPIFPKSNDEPPHLIRVAVTTPSQQAHESHLERSERIPTLPIRIRPSPIRTDRGSCRRHGRLSNVPFLSWPLACVFHLRVQAVAPAAVSTASQDETQRLPRVIWIFPEGDQQARANKLLGGLSKCGGSEIGASSVTERVIECRSAKRTRTVTARPSRDFARRLLATLSARWRSVGR
jgi:hypothetical protein